MKILLVQKMDKHFESYILIWKNKNKLKGENYVDIEIS